MIVPLHRSLARGTLGSLLRQAGPNAAELLDLLDRGTAYLPLPPGHRPEADPLTGITPPETSFGAGGDGPPLVAAVVLGAANRVYRWDRPEHPGADRGRIRGPAGGAG